MSDSRKIMLVVSRPGDTTIAVILADVTEKIKTSRELQEAIIKAVTYWIIQTPEGKAEYERSSCDFNVGDLANAGDEKLTNFLNSLGVYNLDIDACEAGVDHWEFDDHLFDAGEVEEACPS